MANQEQLEIPKQEVDVWNEWRLKHPAEYIDLSNVEKTTPLTTTTNNLG